MFRVGRRNWPYLVICAGLALWAGQGTAADPPAEETAPAPRTLPACTAPIAITLPQAEPGDRPLPINLPTALQLAQVRALDITVAAERVRLAAAQFDRAKVLWLPTILLGGDYFRHDGEIQSVEGRIFGT